MNLSTCDGFFTVINDCDCQIKEVNKISELGQTEVVQPIICQEITGSIRDVRFGLKMGQIGPK